MLVVVIGIYVHSSGKEILTWSYCIQYIYIYYIYVHLKVNRDTGDSKQQNSPLKDVVPVINKNLKQR